MPPWQVLWSEFCALQPENDFDDTECRLKSSRLLLFWLLSAISAYCFGRRKHLFIRNKTQLWCIHARIFAVSVLALIPPIRVYSSLLIVNTSEVTAVSAVDLLSSCYEAIAWIVHSGM